MPSLLTAVHLTCEKLRHPPRNQLLSVAIQSAPEKGRRTDEVDKIIRERCIEFRKGAGQRPHD